MLMCECSKVLLLWREIRVDSSPRSYRMYYNYGRITVKQNIKFGGSPIICMSMALLRLEEVIWE